MANYVSVTLTNYFRVTDENEYKRLFSRLVADDSSVDDFTMKDENGTVFHGFGAYGSIDYCVPLANSDEDEYDDPEHDFDVFIRGLKAILPEDDAFVMMEVGHEKLRSLNGWAIVVTKNNPTKCISLHDDVVTVARDVLKNDKWTLRM